MLVWLWSFKDGGPRINIFSFSNFNIWTTLFPKIMPNFWLTGAPRILKIQWFPSSILIFVLKSCFFGARELVRRKVNIRAYWLPLTKENLFHRLRNWNLNAFHDVVARDLLQGISFQNVFFQPTNRIRNESWILRSPWMSIWHILAINFTYSAFQLF